MAAVMTKTPCFASSRATKPMRRTLVSRSSRVNPSPFERWVRTSSPSRISIRRTPASFSATALASVLLPPPDSPVNHRIAPLMGSVRLDRRRRSSCDRPQVQTALFLLTPAPAPRARVLARCHSGRAGPATDARIAAIVQWVVRDVVRGDIGAHILEGPAHQRVDLDQTELAVPADDRRIGAIGRLVAAHRADPGFVGFERLPQRLHLAD